MRLIVEFLVLLMAAGCASPVPSSSPLAPCEVTLPNGETPPGEEPSPTFHGNGSLFMSGLAEDGEIVVDPRWVNEDGSIGIKFAFWRAPGVGEAGDLEIIGREINTGATVTPTIPGGYGQRFQSTGVTFPTEGCYEITVMSGDAVLTFVTRITKPAAPSETSA